MLTKNRDISLLSRKNEIFLGSHVRLIGSRNLFRVLYFLEARYIALTTVYFRGNFQAIFDDEIKYNNRHDFRLFVTRAGDTLSYGSVK